MKKLRRFYKNSRPAIVRCWVLLLTIIIYHPVHAQKRFSENDQQIISGSGDSTTVNRLLRQASSLREIATDSAILLYRTTLTQSRRLHYQSGIARSLQGLGRSYSNKNELEKSLEAIHESSVFCDTTVQGKEMYATNLLMLSEIYYYRGQYDSCAFYRYEALDEVVANKLMNPAVQIRVYGSMLQFWLNIHEDISHDRYVREIMEHMNALERVALATKDSISLLNIYFHKGGYYNNIGQNDSARYYCNRNIELAKILNPGPSMIVASLLNISTTYAEDKQPEKALAYIKEAISGIPENGKERNRHLIIAEFFMGEAYRQLHDYDRAIAVVEPALAKAEMMNIIRHTDNAHKTLALAYEAKGNYKKAAEHQKQYSAIRDSVMKSEKLEIVYNVEMKYRIADKNKELAQTELALERNESRLKTKNTWIGGISAGLLLLLLTGILIIRNKNHKQKLQTEKIRNLRQEVQISSLQAMIAGEEKERSRIARDLHDGMGGTLGTIRTRLSAIFRKHKTADVSDDFIEVMHLLEEASAELRKTAHNLMPEILLQEGLVKAAELFCERIRKGHMLEINTETWGDVRQLPEDTELTAYRIIQELIHNTMKHAKASKAMVQMIFHETQLCITVEDNGNGMPEDAGKKEGVGLKTIRQRVESLGGQMDIASKPGEGTSIYIELSIASKRQNVS